MSCAVDEKILKNLFLIVIPLVIGTFTYTLFLCEIVHKPNHDLPRLAPAPPRRASTTSAQRRCHRARTRPPFRSFPAPSAQRIERKAQTFSDEGRWDSTPSADCPFATA